MTEFVHKQYSIPITLETNQRIPVKCALCNKPVDDLIVEKDICRDITKMTAKCHGESETIYVPYIEIARGDILEYGFAFNKKQIDNKK